MIVTPPRRRGAFRKVLQRSPADGGEREPLTRSGPFSNRAFSGTTTATYDAVDDDTSNSDDNNGGGNNVTSGPSRRPQFRSQGHPASPLTVRRANQSLLTRGDAVAGDDPDTGEGHALTMAVTFLEDALDYR